MPSRNCFSEVFFPHVFFRPITKFLIINPSGCSGSLLSRTVACAYEFATRRMLSVELLLLSQKKKMLVFVVTLSRVFGLILFKFEEFDHVIFPFSFSPNCFISRVSRTESRVPIQQLSLSISHSVEMQFSAQVCISFFCESSSNIESSHFSSFQWLRLCFFSCIQSILLLQSLLCQFHRYHFRKRCRCPDHCVCLSCVRPHFHLQCYPSLQCRRFRWSRLFISRSLCISFSFVC